MVSYKKILVSLLLCMSMQAQTYPLIGLESLSLSPKTYSKINSSLSNLETCATYQEVKKLVSAINAERKKYLHKKIYGLIATWALENNISWTADFIQTMPKYMLTREYNNTTLGTHLLKYVINTKNNGLVKLLIDKVSYTTLTDSYECAQTINNTEAEQLISSKIVEHNKAFDKNLHRGLWITAGVVVVGVVSFFYYLVPAILIAGIIHR